MSTGQYPHYALPWRTIAQLLLSAAVMPDTWPHRSFRKDAQACVARLRPALHIHGREHIPNHGPCLLTVNHYTRPGFRAWWIALALSAAVPADIHWVMTAAWTYPDRLRASTVTTATRWLFRRFAQVYGFTTMPPMPPDPRDTAARAVAVWQVLAYVRTSARPLVGLAPEGGDSPDGTLQWPPVGAGRFVLHLAQRGLALLPVGSFEREGALCLRFGAPYRLAVPSGLSAAERDRQASETIMHHIAQQLPAHLRGEFS